MCSCKHCCSGKAVSITYSECMFEALGIQHAMCMCHIAICCLYSILSHYLTNGTTVNKKKSYCPHNVVVTSSTTLSATLIILRCTEGDKIKNIYWSSCEVPIIQARFFSTYFKKILKISNFMKIHPVEATLFYLDSQNDGHRDIMMLTVHFSQFCAHT